MGNGDGKIIVLTAISDAKHTDSNNQRWVRDRSFGWTYDAGLLGLYDSGVNKQRYFLRDEHKEYLLGK